MPAVLTQTAPAPPLCLPRNSPLHWWHLLSLDAPTIAAAWGWLFAHAFAIDLPKFSLLTLALGTWCVYVADRLLDGWRPQPGAALRERHRFYARHRRIFFPALLAALLPLAYCLAVRVAARVRWDDLLLALIGLLYFALVHAGSWLGGSHRRTLLPKEFAVGVLFAIAVSVPTWAHWHGATAPLLLATSIFAALCCWNCVAIQTWEDAGVENSASRSRVHPASAWTGAHLLPAALGLAVLSGLFWITMTASPLRWMALCCLLSALLFSLLQRWHRSLHPRTLRVAVDLALLTPLLALVLAR